jgi:predicted metal-dependent enzyme (double-stranded beta helix superfamily)
MGARTLISPSPLPSPAPSSASAPAWASPASAIARPRGRNLSADELQAFVADLAARPELWIDLVKHDSSQRVYEQLFADEHLTAWLICWMDEQDTGFHDHDQSAGAVSVVSGAVLEERLTLGGRPRGRVFRAPASFQFAAADIHRVRHAESDPAVTLHVYSPPLLRMGAYSVDADGVLARRCVSYTEELRPLARAG